MYKSLLTTAAAATLLASTSVFAQTMVRDVQVDVDLTAIQNANAAAYWTTVADDLETAIVARLASQISDEGVSVNVDVDELSLANGFQSILGIEESELKGSVSISNLQDNSDFQKYDLTVSFEPAPVVISPDADMVFITQSTAEYYAQMLEAFAENVAEKLE